MEKDELKIKFIKLKLHFIYCGIITFIIGICLFTVRNYSNSDMATQFSFGATLVGIVLSVIAIFMSIMGEKDISSTKDKLVSVSDELINITDKLNLSANSIESILPIREDLEKGKKEVINMFKEKFDLLSTRKECYGKENNIDYIKLFEINFIIEDSRRFIIPSIYFFYKLNRKNHRFNLFYFVAFVSDIFKMEENFATVLAGICHIFLDGVICDERFLKFILDEISKDNNLKNDIDNYINKILK